MDQEIVKEVGSSPFRVIKMMDGNFLHHILVERHPVNEEKHPEFTWGLTLSIWWYSLRNQQTLMYKDELPAEEVFFAGPDDVEAYSTYREFLTLTKRIVHGI